MNPYAPPKAAEKIMNERTVKNEPWVTSREATHTHLDPENPPHPPTPLRLPSGSVIAWRDRH